MTTNTQGNLQGTFGFDPKESTHHFLVTIARGRAADIVISEHYSWQPDGGSNSVTYSAQADGQVRVVLPRLKWDAIADDVRAHFNLRMRRIGGLLGAARKPGSWRAGENLVRREFGKELVLLAWAIEDADPALISTAVANWLGLQPEERWWLYTQTAAASGHAINGRGIGWRKAVRYALTENPAQMNGSTAPEWFRELPMGNGVPAMAETEAEDQLVPYAEEAVQ